MGPMIESYTRHVENGLQYSKNENYALKVHVYQFIDGEQLTENA